MAKGIKEWLVDRLHLRGLGEFTDLGESPERYRLLRRNMIILMLVITIAPLLLMALINYHQYQKALRSEIVNPLRVLVNKTKHSFELFLAERVSAVSFIASSYSCPELGDDKTLGRIFSVVKREFGGFIDLGCIDAAGVQVSYTGPYQLKGKNYAAQDWYKEVRVKGTYVSDVFLGYRQIPHFVIAVERAAALGDSCILRATIDTERFNNLIASLRLDPTSDAFLLNRAGVFQTPSKFYGPVLQPFPLPLPPVSHEPNVLELKDNQGRDVLMAYAYFDTLPFILAVVKPRGEVLQTWFTLKSEIFILFAGSVMVIFLVIFKLSQALVKRVEESDQRREAAYREMQHTSKLASIGRLAAGVAHEVNNPLAIINEKAGLMKDMVEYRRDFPDKEKFLPLTESILQSVERCRTITHRLLGFARRMEVKIEDLDLNALLREVLDFLGKEAVYRNIEVELQLGESLPHIRSDRGQLQQVFLNIVNNAFEAVGNGGTVSLTSWDQDSETVGVSIHDNGQGMSEETMSHIFEPFFTTKRGYGTGLGLSITYGIVKKLGGDINVKSREGEGTTFNVFLPKKAREQADE